MRRSLLSGLVLLTATVVPSLMFSPHSLKHKTRPSDSPLLLVLKMAKRKASMADKRKLRQAKQQGTMRNNPFATFPKSKFDNQLTAAPVVLDNNMDTNPIKKMSDDPQGGAAERAQELLKRQRASVDMLTMVREKVLSLPLEKLSAALENYGFYVVDEFLGTANNILEQMENEADQLYSDGALQVDVTNLGSGEYTVAITGGAEQYLVCPRMVEWVVSSTKHIPEITPNLSLDPSACMAILRTFDRKAFQASLTLLTGGEQVPETTKPFTTVVSNNAEDKRRLTLQYYLVPDSWDEPSGGGLTFENGGRVAARRDRLVIWKSDASSLRKEAWIGNDETPRGSCLELHLVEKSE